MNYKRMGDEDLMAQVYEILSYDFGKSDEEIFHTPMSRLSILLEEWGKDMKTRYGGKNGK